MTNDMSIGKRWVAWLKDHDPDLDWVNSCRDSGEVVDELIAKGIFNDDERRQARTALNHIRRRHEDGKPIRGRRGRPRQKRKGPSGKSAELAPKTQSAPNEDDYELHGEEQVEADSPDTRDTVAVDHDAQVYRFTFPDRVDGEVVVYEWDAPFKEVSEWCWWYPHQGQNSTRRELCLLAYEHYGRTITERWMARALRVMGVMKASPPLAPHELEKYKRPTEIERIVFQRRQARAQIAVHSSERRQLRRLVREKQEEMQDHEAALDRVVEALREIGSAPPVRKIKLEHRKHLVVTGVCDAHIGKRSIDGEGLKDSVRRFEEASVKMASRIAMWGEPEKIVVALGGDYLHVDNRAGSTTRGTPQDVDASTAQILWSGIQAACTYIDTMRALAPVEVMIVPGNHDEVLTYAIAGALAMRYEGVKDVECEYVEGNRKYLSWHKCLIGLEHGDGPKPSQLATIMTHEMRHAWASAQHCYWLLGHLHHEKVWDTNGCTFLQAPSLAPADSWHDKKGYVLSRKSHTAYIFDPDDGLIGTLCTPMRDLKK